MSRSNKERSRRYMQVLVPRNLCNHVRLLEPELSMRDVAKEAVGLWIGGEGLPLSCGSANLKGSPHSPTKPYS